MTTDNMSAKVTKLSEQLLQDIPKASDKQKPKFVLIYGTVDYDDKAPLYSEHCQNCAMVDVLGSFKALTDRPFATFAETDIKQSMYLGSVLAVKAFYNKQSIMTEIGSLEEITEMINIMKALGYETELIVSHSDDAQQRWEALSEIDRKVLTQRDYLNLDLIRYLFEDVTGAKFADFLASGADKLVVNNSEGKIIGTSEVK